MNIFARAYHNLPLSPTERAFLKFFYGAVFSAVVAGLVAGGQYLATNGTVDWKVVTLVFVGAFGKTLADTFRKYVTAHQDGEVATLLQIFSDTKQSMAAQKTNPQGAFRAPVTPTAVTALVATTDVSK